MRLLTALCLSLCILASACGDADADCPACVMCADAAADHTTADAAGDADGDGFGAPSDCDDTDPGVHPGAESRDEPRPDGSWDIDCDGYATPDSSSKAPPDCVIAKQLASCIGTAPGWVETVPACGELGIWLSSCGGPSPEGKAMCAYEARQQLCR